MPDNDFWIGQEQIPVDLSLLLTYHNDEDYWYAPGEYALRVYTVDTLNTNFARPCFALGERTSDRRWRMFPVLSRTPSRTPRFRCDPRGRVPHHGTR